MIRLQFIGNIGKDAEIRKPDNTPGRAVINFSVAVSEKYKDRDGNPQEKTTWLNCSMWRKEDQLKIANYLLKGQKVYIEGKPNARGYSTAAGDVAASLEVTVESVELLGGAQQPSNGGHSVEDARQQANTFNAFGNNMNNGRLSGNQPQQPSQPVHQQAGFGTHQSNTDDDLPF